jgi:hypothetical protein
MKKIYYWIIIFYLFGLIPTRGLAQVTYWQMEDYLNQVRLDHDREGMMKNMYKDVEGSPFLPKEFREGKIQIKDEGLYGGKLRYDMYANEMQYIAKENIYAVAFPKDIEFIEIEDLMFIYTSYLSAPSGSDLKESYFVVLMNGNCKLLAGKEVLLLDAEPEKPYIPAKPAHFIQKKDSYYIKKNDFPAVKISNRKSLTGILEDKETEVLRFIKKEKISHNDPEDLKKLVEHYNNLEKRED